MAMLDRRSKTQTKLGNYMKMRSVKLNNMASKRASLETGTVQPQPCPNSPAGQRVNTNEFAGNGNKTE